MVNFLKFIGHKINKKAPSHFTFRGKFFYLVSDKKSRFYIKKENEIGYSHSLFLYLMYIRFFIFIFQNYLDDTLNTATHVISNITPFPLLLASILFATRVEYEAVKPPAADTAGPIPGTTTPSPPIVPKPRA